MSVFVERAWTNIDKTGWGNGAWNDEPDKVQWVDEDTGYDCLAVRQPSGGHWCGYVGVPPEHPCHGAGFDDVLQADGEYPAVHGGITFADTCMENLPEGRGVCHVPYDGRPADVWWLGFDCAHSGDASPGYQSSMQAFGSMLTTIFEGHADREEYRTLEYVRSEVATFATQLVTARVETPSWKTDDE